MRAFALMFAFIFVSAVQAAPHPGTSTSTFVSADRGLVRSRYGFHIDAFLTDWELTTIPNKLSSSIQAVYRAKKQNQGVMPTMTVRVDHLKKAQSTQDYFRRWKQEYPRFGFDLYRADKVRLPSDTAYLVDIVQSQHKRQLRQYILTRGKLAVVLTCRDHVSTFEQTVKTCNQIARNFRWDQATSLRP